MRLGFCKSKESGKRELLLRPGRGESVNASRLLWLKANDRPVLLTLLRLEGRSAEKSRLYYDVDGYVSFRSYIRKIDLSVETLGSMFASIIQVVSWCMSQGVGYSKVLFDEHYVFVDRCAGLHFAYVPLDAMERKTGNSPLALLRVLCDTGRMTFESPDAQTLCERLGDYVLGEEGAFSINRFRKFARMETGMMPVTDGLHSEMEGDTADTTASMRDARWERSTEERVDSSMGMDSSGSGRLRTACYVLYDHALDVGYGFNKNEVTIGRGSLCDVRPHSHPKLSRAHALIRVKRNEVWLCDLGSSNGTAVGGVRLRPYDEVRISLGEPFFLAGDEFRVERREGK